MTTNTAGMILWTEMNCIDDYQLICCFPLWKKIVQKADSLLLVCEFVWLGVGRSAQDVCYISEVKGEVSRLCSAEEK